MDKMRSKEKLKIIIGKYGAIKLCYLEDENKVDLLDELPHTQTLNFFDELVRRWNEYDELVEDCGKMIDILGQLYNSRMLTVDDADIFCDIEARFKQALEGNRDE